MTTDQSFLSCTKLTVYSIAYIVIYTRVLQNMVKQFWCVSYSTRQPLSSVRMLRKVIRMCHITAEFTERIGKSLNGVRRVVTLVKPLNGKTENILQNILHELKRLSG
jgi:hypothetical protein